MSSQLDFDYRPSTYFHPIDFVTWLRATVKGARRRAMLERYIASGQLDRAPELVLKAVLPDTERAAFGRMHPSYMGGEYLATRHEGEVEIARITIRSTTWDVTSVYVRRHGDDYLYRIVDEYEGDTLEGPSELRHPEPLCLGQLINFFLGAWRLDLCIECNIADERYPERMLNFAVGESAFYPDFGAFIREEVEDMVNAELYARACREAEDEDIDPPTPPVRRGLPPDPMQPAIDAIEAALAAMTPKPVDER